MSNGFTWPSECERLVNRSCSCHLEIVDSSKPIIYIGRAKKSELILEANNLTISCFFSEIVIHYVLKNESEKNWNPKICFVMANYYKNHVFYDDIENFRAVSRKLFLCLCVPLGLRGALDINLFRFWRLADLSPSIPFNRMTVIEMIWSPRIHINPFLTINTQ